MGFAAKGLALWSLCLGLSPRKQPVWTVTPSQEAWVPAEGREQEDLHPGESQSRAVTCLGWSLSCLWPNSELQSDHTNDTVPVLSFTENSEGDKRQWHQQILESNMEQAGSLPLYSQKQLKNMCTQRTIRILPSLKTLLNFPFSESTSMSEGSL